MGSTKSKLAILDVTASIHEIEQRLGMIEEIDKFANLDPSTDQQKDDRRNLRVKWEEMLKIPYENEQEFRNFSESLNNFLMEIIKFETKTSEVEGDGVKILMQIHLRNLATTLLREKEDEVEVGTNVWAKFGEGGRAERLAKLLRTRFGPIRFEHLKMGWRRMEQQTELGQPFGIKFSKKNVKKLVIGAKSEINLFEGCS